MLAVSSRFQRTRSWRQSWEWLSRTLASNGGRLATSMQERRVRARCETNVGGRRRARAGRERDRAGGTEGGGAGVNSLEVTLCGEPRLLPSGDETNAKGTAQGNSGTGRSGKAKERITKHARRSERARRRRWAALAHHPSPNAQDGLRFLIPRVRQHPAARSAFNFKNRQKISRLLHVTSTIRSALMFEALEDQAGRCVSLQLQQASTISGHGARFRNSRLVSCSCAV